jgi:hypothetical protein
MARHGKKDVDDRLLAALACGATPEAAARSACRRLAEPAFRQRLQGLRSDMVQRTAGALTAAGAEAVRALLALLREAAPAAVRLGAARSVLELGVKLREAAELEERLTALEEQVAANDGGHRL